ncbi:hypothetical protein NDU88_002258 [Pleurodeles waltl]|uniref:Uncharacterized protein n=1 Tax=Pleurodeles waltl TaxID=8319 RepID=A0AAV7QB64_PLEWA|nr:hypothetical protein NDU88_002258 [Pleurodeles waltl]
MDGDTEDNEVPGAAAVGRIRGETTEGCLEPALHRCLRPEEEEERKKETQEPDWERDQEDQTTVAHTPSHGPRQVWASSLFAHWQGAGRVG